MAISSNSFLKISAGVALLLGGGAVADYYMVTLPRQAEQAAQQQADARQATNAAQAALQQKADDEQERKRTAYKVCVSSADADYATNWALGCDAKAKAAEASYKACLAYPGTTPEQCRAANPVVSPTTCTLPTPQADNLNDQLRQAKDGCMKEAQSGIAA